MIIRLTFPFDSLSLSLCERFSDIWKSMQRFHLQGKAIVYLCLARYRPPVGPTILWNLLGTILHEQKMCIEDKE
jgi:hypothetical protein